MLALGSVFIIRFNVYRQYRWSFRRGQAGGNTCSRSTLISRENVAHRLLHSSTAVRLPSSLWCVRCNTWYLVTVHRQLNSSKHLLLDYLTAVPLTVASEGKIATRYASRYVCIISCSGTRLLFFTYR